MLSATHDPYGGLAQPPAPRRRRRWPFVALALAVALVAAVVVAVTLVHHRSAGGRLASPYVDSSNRYAAWDAPGREPFSSEQIGRLSSDVSIETIPSAADGYNITKHFADARAMTKQAASQGKHLQVYEYFNATRWYDNNVEGWRPYSNSFQQSWLLRDSSGALIPAYASDSAAKPYGYVMDLSNPALRQWIVSTIVSWMKQAPYSGIAFDSVLPMIGDQIDPRLQHDNGRTSYNQTLCGASEAAAVGSQPCSRVQAWNTGLTDLLSATTQALSARGMKVIYNGIGPSDQRSSDRNLSLLRYTGGAANEQFCITRAGNPKFPVRFNSVTADAAIMREVAAAGKKTIEITNYSAHATYASYCLAAFLMGWQPGSSYWVYHQSYYSLNDNSFTDPPERNLNLGAPDTVGYTAQGNLLSRGFERGLVAIDTGVRAGCVKTTLNASSFAGGHVVAHYSAGACVPVPAHGQVFLLYGLY